MFKRISGPYHTEQNAPSRIWFSWYTDSGGIELHIDDAEPRLISVAAATDLLTNLAVQIDTAMGWESGIAGTFTDRIKGTTS